MSLRVSLLAISEVILQHSRKLEWILWRVWVTYKWVLDWVIGFIAPYKFTQFGTTGSYRAIAILHTLQSTIPHAIGSLIFASRILATDLSQSHCNFKSHVTSSCHSLIPFLSFLQLPILKTRLLQSTLIYSFYSVSAPSCLLTMPTITPRHGPHGKHRLLLSRMRVFWSVT
jgi:hypothetical protein